jgi:hypothetical protein
MSTLAYRGAITTARKHARLLATAFDLHRFDMLDALHYELPLTPQDELELNSRLSKFLDSRGTVRQMRMFPYRHNAAVTSQEARPEDSNGTVEDEPPGA